MDQVTRNARTMALGFSAGSVINAAQGEMAAALILIFTALAVILLAIHHEVTIRKDARIFAAIRNDLDIAFRSEFGR